MPSALAGQDDGYQYEYSIEQDVARVLEFYKAELPKLGWMLDGTGTSYQGDPLLTFDKAGKILGISVAKLTGKDGLVLVTLAFP
jgi:hypothetical protein